MLASRAPGVSTGRFNEQGTPTSNSKRGEMCTAYPRACAPRPNPARCRDRAASKWEWSLATASCNRTRDVAPPRLPMRLHASETRTGNCTPGALTLGARTRNGVARADLPETPALRRRLSSTTNRIGAMAAPNIANAHQHRQSFPRKSASSPQPRMSGDLILLARLMGVTRAIFAVGKRGPVGQTGGSFNTQPHSRP